MSDLHFVSKASVAEIQALGSLADVLALLGAKRAGKPIAKLLGKYAVFGRLGVNVTGIAAGVAAYRYLTDLVRYRRTYAPARELLLRQLATEKPDHIVVSGDVTTLAADREMQEAREYVRKLAAISKSGRVTIVPGNHDVPQHKQFWVRNRHGEKKLEQYLNEFGESEPTSVTDGDSGAHPFPAAQVVGDVCFIALDSTRVGIPLNVAGRIDDGQLNRLRDMLQRSEIRGSFKILVMHHQLVPPPEEILAAIKKDDMSKSSLENAEEVAQVLRLGEIDAILHGHVHKAYSNPGPVPAYCAGCTPELIANGDDVAFRVFELRNGTLVVHEHGVEMPRAN